MEEFSWESLLLKYFLHGVLFSGIFLVMVFVWVFIFAVLVILGLFIGLILGFIVLLFIIGGINVFLANLIWNIPVRSDWKSVLIHGFILFIILIIVSIPSTILNFFVPDLAITIILFIIYCFIDGLVAKNVADLFEGE